MAPKRKPKLDLVIPVFNEAGVIEKFYEQLSIVLVGLPAIIRIFFVDDGSTDGTADALRCITDLDPRVTVLTLSRNFGHQAALTAGLDVSQGDFVVSLDGDGQHPPEMIPQILELLNQGYDIVQGQRVEDTRAFSFKQITSLGFYALINRISGTQMVPGAADFRGMRRQAVDALKAMPEYHRFLRGMVSWLGYKSVILPYHEPSRMAGKSKYSLSKMLRLALDAIFSFSLMPLYIGLSAGAMFFCFAVIEMTYVLSFWIRDDIASLEPGWGSLMFVILTASGMLMVLLGFIGIYVGYIFHEVKSRPVYLIRRDEENERNG
jgi:polyisoprenyl-phosphate glycosyltransferase